MTNIEHMMLSVCFLKEKHKAKKEQNVNDDKERTGDNL